MILVIAIFVNKFRHILEERIELLFSLCERVTLLAQEALDKINGNSDQYLITHNLDIFRLLCLQPSPKTVDSLQLCLDLVVLFDGSLYLVLAHLSIPPR